MSLFDKNGKYSKQYFVYNVIFAIYLHVSRFYLLPNIFLKLITLDSKFQIVLNSKMRLQMFNACIKVPSIGKRKCRLCIFFFTLLATFLVYLKVKHFRIFDIALFLFGSEVAEFQLCDITKVCPKLQFSSLL